jgi:hypothetical protein
LPPTPTGALITFHRREITMSTTELSFVTPTEPLSALAHLLGYIPTNDIIALVLGTTHYQTDVPLRAAIRCSTAIDHSQAQRLPTLCHINAQQFSGALLVTICDADHHGDALTARTPSVTPCAATESPYTAY